MYKLFLHGGSDNHGCEAIVRSTVKLVDKPMVLYSRHPEMDIKYGIDDICEIRYDEQTIITKKIKKAKAALQIKLTGKLDLFARYRYEKLFLKMSEDDIFISIGGDNYCYPGTEILASINNNIKRKGAKLVLWACSVEPELLNDKGIVKDLKRYDLITARESISYEVLQKINKSTVLVADPAFTLDTEELPLPDGWMEGRMVGINASPLIMESSSNPQLVYQAYKYLIQGILEDTSYGIALIPHVVSEKNDDYALLKRIKDEINDNRIVLIDDCNCMQLKGYIARCSLFVGARTHATIAAYSSCVPTLVLGYSVKSRGIARDLFGTEENYVLSVQSLEKKDELLQGFNWLLDHREGIRNHLRTIMPEYVQKAYIGKDAIKQLQDMRNA